MSEQNKTSENWVENTINSSVAPSHSIRAVLVGLLMFVFGIYGIYDYQWAIPAEQLAFERGEISRNVLASLDAVEAEEETQLIPTTIDSLEVLIAEVPKTEVEDEDSVEWSKTLVIYRDGLKPPSDVSPTDWPSLRAAAKAQADKALAIYGDATQPSSYDRPIQWLFIACLLFVPFYAWSFLSTRKRHYQLDPDGTLHMPEGVWKQEEIADIDMNRWMAKSICWVVSTDSTRIKLDAHIYKNLDKIIGVIAHRLRPDEWSLDARPVTLDKSSTAATSEED